MSLSPKTAAAYVDFSRRFAIQSTVDAEQLVRNDLMESMARRRKHRVDGNFLLNESGTIGGMPFVTNNTVSSNLTKGSENGVCSAVYFGDWSQLVWATWGNPFDLLTDPDTGSKEGTVRVVCFTDTDFARRHPESMAVCLDVTTT